MEKGFNGVVFRLQGLSFALDALAIREIVGGADWKPLSVEGESERFIQVRGKVAFVIDLRELFGFSPSTGEGLNSFIAVEAPGGDRSRLAALWVDTVLELVSVPGSQLKAPDRSEVPLKYVRALFQKDEVTVHVLKVEEILENAFSGRALALENKAS